MELFLFSTWLVITCSFTGIGVKIGNVLVTIILYGMSVTMECQIQNSSNKLLVLLYIYNLQGTLQIVTITNFFAGIYNYIYQLDCCASTMP